MSKNKNNGDAVLKSIAQRIQTCKKCELWIKRTIAVPGEGPKNVRLMLIGEAPGKMEDSTGRPFVGKAGKLLDNTLIKNNVNRSDVFITNVVKCRPPKNRNPTHMECDACSVFLKNQIRFLSPNIIITLGNISTYEVLSLYNLRPKNIGMIHGTVFNNPSHDFLIIPTYHPAACIYNPTLKDSFCNDIRLAIYLSKLEGSGK